MSTMHPPRLRLPFPAVVLVGAGLLALAALGTNNALAQAPTKAQQSAIRSACPDDYRSLCASVPPGGQASLACLQQNAAKLSDACRTAVQAVGGGSATAPADAASTSTDAKPGAKAATSTPAPAPAAPAAKTATPAPSPAPEALAPRQELALVRQSCARDVRTHCRGVPIGGGNIVACLKANAASLSSRCQSALAPFAR
jgi:hypothetical protein